METNNKETRTYYGIVWDNYYGEGSIEEIELTLEEYKSQFTNRMNEKLHGYWGVYPSYQEAQRKLNEKYCD